MNVLAEMTQLAVARPGVDAPPVAVSEWFAAKARLHEYLAARGGPDSVREAKLCQAARDRSLALLSPGTDR